MGARVGFPEHNNNTFLVLQRHLAGGMCGCLQFWVPLKQAFKKDTVAIPEKSLWKGRDSLKNAFTKDRNP